MSPSGSHPGRPSDSAVEATHLVLPPDTNTHGTAFGGRIMEWMDIAAGICAQRHSGGGVVTMALDGLVFARPIRMGDVVIVKASVNYAGSTSMEIGVRVEREDANTRALEHALTGYFTFVGVDDHGRPRPVPQVLPHSDIERRRYEDALRRREHRLRSRG